MRYLSVIKAMARGLSLYECLGSVYINTTYIVLRYKVGHLNRFLFQNILSKYWKFNQNKLKTHIQIVTLYAQQSLEICEMAMGVSRVSFWISQMRNYTGFHLQPLHYFIHYTYHWRIQDLVGGGRTFSRDFADVGKWSQVSEASQYWPGSRALRWALEALGF